MHLAAQGYRITSEQIEQGHAKGSEQCCWALVCVPHVSALHRLYLRTRSSVARTCAAAVQLLRCGGTRHAQLYGSCGVELLGKSTPDRRTKSLNKRNSPPRKPCELRESFQQLDRLLVDSLGVDYRQMELTNQEVSGSKVQSS